MPRTEKKVSKSHTKEVKSAKGHAKEAKKAKPESGSKTVSNKKIDIHKQAEKWDGDKNKGFNPSYMSKNKYEPDGKPTELDKINHDPAHVKLKIKNLIDKGRVEIETRDELLNFPLGSLVSYLTKPKMVVMEDGKRKVVNNGKSLYRSGGFLRAVEDDYFTLQGGQPWSPISFCVQFENVEKMYVGNPTTTKDDFISIQPTKQEPTKHPVMIGDTVVYYGKDAWKANRFKSTKKYEQMVKWYEKYGNPKV